MRQAHIFFKDLLAVFWQKTMPGMIRMALPLQDEVFPIPCQMTE